MEKGCAMIEILMATYNGEGYLQEQLESIEKQTHREWHLTVHDDGSTDRTWQILEDFQKRMGEKKVFLQKNVPPTGSAKKNFIGLLQNCDSPYMMCCDQDDVWHSDKVEKTFHRMKQMERKYGKDIPLLVHTDLRVVDENLNCIHPGFHEYMNLETRGYLRHELIQNQVTGCTVMINQKLKTYVNQVSCPDKILMHDHWLALTALVFGKMSYLKEATIDYRQHGDNSVGAQNAKSFEYRWMRFRRGRKKFRQDMGESTEQVLYFTRLYATCINDKKMLKLLNEYAFLYKKNKITRIFYFFCDGFWKRGTVRKIMQIIWG